MPTASGGTIDLLVGNGRPYKIKFCLKTRKVRTDSWKDFGFMDETKTGEPIEIETLSLGRNVPGQSLVLASLGLLAIGVVAVNSAVATVSESGSWYARVDVRHTIFACVAVVVLLLGWQLNYRWLAAGSWLPLPALLMLLLAGGLALLVFVPGLGHAVGGKYRWIRVGPRQYSIGFQPSEFIKISLVVFLAAWLTRPKTNVRSFRVFLLAMIVAGASAVLVLTQDFGTAILIGIVAMVVMFLAGVPWFYLAAIIPPVVIAGCYFIIETPYRLGRLLAMLDPWCRSNQAAYQARQSLLAILAGSWKGVGLGNGVRKLGFLPEDSTDFIFAGFCEEWGFRGVVLLIALLLLWLMFCRKIAVRAVDPFGRVLAGGLGAMIIIQAMLHIAVNMVLLPPTGISMPFISAGGTSLVLMACAVSLIVSVSARQPVDEIATIEN